MSLSVNIKKNFKGFRLNVCFSTNKEYLGILGASGSGKSMTLKCIAGIETPDEGKIVLNDRVLFDSDKRINLKPQERNVGYLFQNYALFPNMTVEENIGAGLKFHRNKNKEIIKDIINNFHLNGLEKKYPVNLSGGQQQRVALARAIAYKPDILMLDEPFSALDPHLKDHLQRELVNFLKIYHGEVLMVTHSRDEAYKFCENILIVDSGSSVIFGNTKNIFNDPKYLSTAKITGCKNISKCEVITPNSVYATDWDIIINTEKEVTANIKYVGIHSHSFELHKDEPQKSDINIVKCKIININEEIFDYSLIVENAEAKIHGDNSEIILKIKKEDMFSIDHKDYIYIKIPQNSVLLLNQ